MNEIDTLVVIVAVVLIAAVVVLLLGYHPSKFGSIMSITTAPILLIDPSHVPPGTQAILVTYSSLGVESNGAWRNATGSGTVNLFTVENNSKILGYANIATGAEVEAVRISIDSVKIRVNGATYAVSVPNPNVIVTLGSNSVIGSRSGILVDLLTTVIAQPGTVFLGQGDPPGNYTMTPVVRAIVIGGMDNITNTYISNTVKINSTVKAEIGFLV